jgi:peptide/nickel transport system permease protein
VSLRAPAPATGLATAAPASEWRRRDWQRSWYRFRRNPSAVIGSLIVLAVVLTALLAPWIATHPSHVGNVVDFAARHQPPSAEYLLGTDQVGRDVFSRVVFGYRISLTLVVVVLGVSVPFGVVLGLLAGYYGGWVETLIMRLTDVFLAIPALVMALALTAALTPNLTNAMIAISALWWTWHTRLVYGIVRSLRTEEYVEAAQLLGASTFHLLFRELLPNCVSAITVKVTLDAGFVILIGAGLSFLGLGAQPPAPDLGTMVSTGSRYLPDMWWQSVFPGLAILVAILGFNLLGDGLRDQFDVEVGG